MDVIGVMLMGWWGQLQKWKQVEVQVVMEVKERRELREMFGCW